MQGYLNLKGYGEFDAANRPSGWNTWVTFAISPEAPSSTVAPTRQPCDEVADCIFARMESLTLQAASKVGKETAYLWIVRSKTFKPLGIP